MTIEVPFLELEDHQLNELSYDNNRMMSLLINGSDAESTCDSFSECSDNDKANSDTDEVIEVFDERMSISMNDYQFFINNLDKIILFL